MFFSVYVSYYNFLTATMAEIHTLIVFRVCISENADLGI